MTVSQLQLRRVIRAAKLTYAHLYKVNPFSAFDYAASLDRRMGRLVEFCVPVESNEEWPLEERLHDYRAHGERGARAMWALDRSLPQ